MNVVVIGASGATGRLVVSQLLEKGVAVKAVLRTRDAIPAHANLQKIEASVHRLSVEQLQDILEGVDAVISCLGHNLTFKGMFGKPRRLVTETLQNVCRAIQGLPDSGTSPKKVVLMNTTGNSNRDIPEVPPLSQRLVVAILRLLLPPHVDNENAADFLREHIGQNNPQIQWVALRPDALTNEADVSEYDLTTSPTRNAIFDSGASSRINVAHCMVQCVLDDALWQKWQGQMPVLYNRG